MAADENSGSKEVDPRQTGTEYNTHMTNDGAPGSHSELFGLGAKDGDGSSHEDSGKHYQPGDVIAEEHKGTSGGGSDPTPAEPEAKTAGIAKGSSDNVPPGAGSTQATPEQGTGEV